MPAARYFLAVGFEDRVGQVVDVDVGLGDAVACEEVELLPMIGVDTTGAKGFGISPVSGKCLVPLPAASTPPSSNPPVTGCADSSHKLYSL